MIPTAILPLIITINKQSACEWMGSLPSALKHSFQRMWFMGGGRTEWEDVLFVTRTFLKWDAFQSASQSMQIDIFNHLGRSPSTDQLIWSMGLLAYAANAAPVLWHNRALVHLKKDSNLQQTAIFRAEKSKVAVYLATDNWNTAFSYFSKRTSCPQIKH